MLCTPRAPRCPVCPWTRHCVARAEGRQEQLPTKTRKKPPVRIEAVTGVLERRGEVLAVQRPKRGLLGGMWELPGGEIAAGETAEEALVRWFREGLGLAMTGAEALGSVEHVFTHRRLRLHVFRCKPAVGRVRRQGWDAHRWVRRTGLDAMAFGGPARKALALAREHAGRS
jgi:A/G-specific adenine glycosylase